jgi:hypothetical protein
MQHRRLSPETPVAILSCQAFLSARTPDRLALRAGEVSVRQARQGKGKVDFDSVILVE